MGARACSPAAGAQRSAAVAAHAGCARCGAEATGLAACSRRIAAAAAAASELLTGSGRLHAQASRVVRWVAYYGTTVALGWGGVDGRDARLFLLDPILFMVSAFFSTM